MKCEGEVCSCSDMESNCTPPESASFSDGNLRPTLGIVAGRNFAYQAGPGSAISFAGSGLAMEKILD